MKRVVITGAGIVSCLGNTLKDVGVALKAGQSGISFQQTYADQGLRSQVAGTVSIDREIERQYKRFMSPAAQYGYVAIQDTVASSGLTLDQISDERTGLVVSSGGTAVLDLYNAFKAYEEKGVKRVGPYMVTKAMGSGVSATLATAFKIKGHSYSLSSACATSLHCVGHAVELIQLGKQDRVLAGGAEEESWQLSMLFDAMGALSSKYNDQPQQASRPYDATRDGFVIAGGAGMLLVESLDSALARNATILAEITGYSATSDGYDMVAPSGEGAERCIKLTLGDNLALDYVNMHGTSTQAGDLKELQALKKVMGSQVPDFSSTKSMTGHSLGAVGVQELIYCLIMMQDSFIAPSINVQTLEAEAEGLPLIREKTHKKLDRVLSNSFGFGGTNASILLESFKS